MWEKKFIIEYFFVNTLLQMNFLFVQFSVLELVYVVTV